MEKQIKSAIYIGVNAPSDDYRERLLKIANIGVLKARLIKHSVPDFLKTMEAVLRKESPEIIVLDENMPTNLMMQTFSLWAGKGVQKGKSIKVYGIDDGTSADDVIGMDESEIKDYLDKSNNNPLRLVMGELKY